MPTRGAHLDGRELYGEADAATHRRIGERFAQPAFTAHGAFTQVTYAFTWFMYADT